MPNFSLLDIISAQTKKQQYETSRRQPKRSCPDSGASDEEALKIPEPFPRWLVIQGTDDKESFMKLTPFAIGKSLKCHVGILDTVKKLERGDILIKTENRVYADK